MKTQQHACRGFQNFSCRLSKAVVGMLASPRRRAPRRKLISVICYTSVRRGASHTLNLIQRSWSVPSRAKLCQNMQVKFQQMRGPKCRKRHFLESKSTVLIGRVGSAGCKSARPENSDCRQCWMSRHLSPHQCGMLAP